MALTIASELGNMEEYTDFSKPIKTIKKVLYIHMLHLFYTKICGQPKKYSDYLNQSKFTPGVRGGVRVPQSLYNGD